MCNELLRLGGLTRLLELCKEPMERNYSDAVLVACLAVVRRVRNNLKMDREDQTYGTRRRNVALIPRAKLSQFTQQVEVL